MQSFILEGILALMLMVVILNVSGQFAGVAIGAVIALEALFAGPISGASMNPARSLAPAIISGKLDFLWVYLTAPFAGALLGVAIGAIIGGTNERRRATHIA
jgi:aquaporin NIP